MIAQLVCKKENSESAPLRVADSSFYPYFIPNSIFNGFITNLDLKKREIDNPSEPNIKQVSS